MNQAQHEKRNRGEKGGPTRVAMVSEEAREGVGGRARCRLASGVIGNLGGFSADGGHCWPLSAGVLLSRADLLSRVGLLSIACRLSSDMRLWLPVVRWRETPITSCIPTPSTFAIVPDEKLLSKLSSATLWTSKTQRSITSSPIHFDMLDNIKV